MESPNDKDELFYYIVDPEPEDDRNPYKNRIKEVNLLLTMNGLSEIGDLFDPSLFSVNKTLIVLQSLLDDRQKILDSKSDLLLKMSKTEKEYLTLIDKTETNKDKIGELTNRNNFLKNKMSLDEKKFKEELDKIKLEKLELEKCINRLTMKENQFKHEIKKNEKEIEDLKSRLKKLLGDNKEKDKEKSSQNTNNSTLINTKNHTINSEISPGLKLSNTINSIMLDNNQAKNSANYLHNVNHLKEFYNLIFQAFNEKVSSILNENEELKDCYRLILKEINQFIDYKKLILYKFSQDSLDSLKSVLKDNNQFLNLNIFELDFNDSRDVILTNFNEIINIFRFILIYDVLKIEPNNEFEFQELKKLVMNKKYEFENLPYYKEIKNTMDSFDFEKLNSLKNMIVKSMVPISAASTTSRKKGMMKDEIFLADSNIEKNLSAMLTENRPIEFLEEINKELIDTMNTVEEKFEKMGKDLDKLNSINNKK